MAKRSYLDKMIDDIGAEIEALDLSTERQRSELFATRARLVKERNERAEAKKAKATA